MSNENFSKEPERREKKQFLMASQDFGSDQKRMKADDIKLKKDFSHEGLMSHYRNENERTKSDFFNKNKAIDIQSMKNISDASFFSCLCT